MSQGSHSNCGGVQVSPGCSQVGHPDFRVMNVRDRPRMERQTCLQTYDCFPFCVFKNSYLDFTFHLYLYYSKDVFIPEIDIILHAHYISIRKKLMN